MNPFQHFNDLWPLLAATMVVVIAWIKDHKEK
jgi:hypothetical protein